jgi:hypothetical protein
VGGRGAWGPRGHPALDTTDSRGRSPTQYHLANRDVRDACRIVGIWIEPNLHALDLPGRLDATTWQRALAHMPDYVTEDEMRARWDSLTPTQQKVAEVVARREGSPFSVAVLSRYGETKDAVQGAVEALEREAVLLREHGRPFRGALVDPLFELWIAEGRHWPR